MTDVVNSEAKLQYRAPAIEPLGKVADITQAQAIHSVTSDGVPYGGQPGSGGTSPHHSG